MMNILVMAIVCGTIVAGILTVMWSMCVAAGRRVPKP